MRRRTSSTRANNNSSSRGTYSSKGTNDSNIYSKVLLGSAWTPGKDGAWTVTASLRTVLTRGIRYGVLAVSLIASGRIDCSFFLFLRTMVFASVFCRCELRIVNDCLRLMCVLTLRLAFYNRWRKKMVWDVGRMIDVEYERSSSRIRYGAANAASVPKLVEWPCRS